MRLSKVAKFKYYMSGKLLPFVVLTGLGLSLTSSSTAEVDVSKLPPADKKQGVTYAADIKPIFEHSCLKCHGEDKPKSKYRVDSRESTIKGGKSGDAAVIPGKSDKSLLVHYVSDLVEEMEMPPKDKRDKYPPLTKQQIGLIRAWIDQGAK